MIHSFISDSTLDERDALREVRFLFGLSVVFRQAGRLGDAKKCLKKANEVIIGAEGNPVRANIQYDTQLWFCSKYIPTRQEGFF